MYLSCIQGPGMTPPLFLISSKSQNKKNVQTAPVATLSLDTQLENFLYQPNRKKKKNHQRPPMRRNVTTVSCLFLLTSLNNFCDIRVKTLQHHLLTTAQETGNILVIRGSNLLLLIWTTSANNSTTQRSRHIYCKFYSLTAGKELLQTSF